MLGISGLVFAISGTGLLGMYGFPMNLTPVRWQTSWQSWLGFGLLLVGLALQLTAEIMRKVRRQGAR